MAFLSPFSLWSPCTSALTGGGVSESGQQKGEETAQTNANRPCNLLLLFSQINARHATENGWKLRNFLLRVCVCESTPADPHVQGGKKLSNSPGAGSRNATCFSPFSVHRGCMQSCRYRCSFSAAFNRPRNVTQYEQTFRKKQQQEALYVNGQLKLMLELDNRIVFQCFLRESCCTLRPTPRHTPRLCVPIIEFYGRRAGNGSYRFATNHPTL